MAMFSVKVDRTKVTGSHTNFPLYIDLADMPVLFWATVSETGGDIRCYADRGKVTELARDVVTVDRVGKTGELHVLLQTLTPDIDTTVYVDVDGSRTDYHPSATYGSRAVWVDYAAVYHDAIGTNSVAAVNNTVDVGSPSVGGKTGILGTSTEFTGTQAGVIPSTPDLEFASGERFTWQIWVKPSTTAAGHSRAVSLQATGGPTAYKFFRREDDQLLYVITDGSGGGTIASPSITANTWYRMTLSVDMASGVMLTFLDDTQLDSRTMPWSNGFELGIDTLIGTYRTDLMSESWLGELDEFRVARFAASADRVSTEQANQASPGTFYAVTTSLPGASSTSRVPSIPSIPVHVHARLGMSASVTVPQTPQIMGTPTITPGTSPSYRWCPVAIPSGVSVGEMVVVIFHSQVEQVPDGTIPSTWKLLASRKGQPGGSRTFVAYGWPVHTAGDIISGTVDIGTPSGGRGIAACFRVAGVDLDHPLIGLAPQGVTGADNFSIGSYLSDVRSLSIHAVGSQATSGQAAIPLLSTGLGDELVAEGSEPAGLVGSRTSLAVYAQPTGYFTPSWVGTFPGAVAVNGGLGFSLQPASPLPRPPILPGVPTIAALASAQNSIIGHRGSSANYPEMSMYGYQEVARTGVQALEISLNRTSDGVWFGMHDGDLLRISGASVDPTTLTWADLNASYQILGSTATLNPMQPDRPFARFEDIAAAFPTHVLVVDPKYRFSLSERAEFRDLLDTYGGGRELDGTPTLPTERCIVKASCTSLNVATYMKAAGYTTWGYFYAADMANFATYEPNWDWLSMDYGVTAGDWVTAVSTGKPVVGHVTQSQDSVDICFAGGAIGVVASDRGATFPTFIP